MPDAIPEDADEIHAILAPELSGEFREEEQPPQEPPYLGVVAQMLLSSLVPALLNSRPSGTHAEIPPQNSVNAVDAVVFVLTGSLDLYSRPFLYDLLRRAVQMYPHLRAIVLDLTELDFLDSAGLTLIVELRQARFHQSSIALVVPQSDADGASLPSFLHQPLRALSLARFDTYFPLVHSQEEAVKAAIDAAIDIVQKKRM